MGCLLLCTLATVCPTRQTPPLSARLRRQHVFIACPELAVSLRFLRVRLLDACPQAQSAKPKARVTPRAATPAATASGTNKARSPGLRRRDLLGGAEDIQLQAKVAAASATPSPASDAAAAAGDGPALSVVSLSATNRFRARRELERWVRFAGCAGWLAGHRGPQSDRKASRYAPPCLATPIWGFADPTGGWSTKRAPQTRPRTTSIRSR